MSDELNIPNPGYRGNQAGRYGTGQSRVRQGMDPDTRRLMMFAGGLGAILVMLIGASTLIGHRSSGEVPVITADLRPIRIKPENPGGMKIDGAENDVFSGGSDTAGSKLAPPSENPDAKALHTPTTIAPTPSALPSPSAPMSAAVIPSPNPPAMKPAAGASAPAATATAGGNSAPVLLAKPSAPATVKVPPALPTKIPAPAAAETHPALPGHQATVQLAALPSEDAARNEWQLLSKRMPELMNGKQPVFSRIERDGRTFWRVRTSGFADMTQARSFCDHVRAKGGGCSVADF